VIAAADDIAIDMPGAQRHGAVAATILQCGDLALLGAEQHHGLVQELAAQRLAGAISAAKAATYHVLRMNMPISRMASSSELSPHSCYA
jgi:hypothetical protein